MLSLEAEAEGRPAHLGMAGITMANALSTVRTALVVVIAGAALLAGCASGASSSAAATTVAVVDVDPVAGGPAPNLTDVASRLSQLLSAMGFANAQANVTSGNQVTVTVDGAVPVTQLQAALEPGPLLFRKVLNVGPDQSKRSTAPTPGPSAPADVTADSVKAVVGNQAWAAAMALVGTHNAAQTGSDHVIVNVLAPFGKLTPAEVAVLPATMQFYVPQIGCAALNGRPRGVTDSPQATVVVCDGKSTKYLLDVAKVSGSDVGSASAAPDESSSAGAWAVDVAFSSAGAGRWSALTAEAFNNSGGHCVATQSAVETGHAPVCQIALVQDNVVLTAPSIQAVLSSKATLAGAFTQKQAATLVAELALAGLPVSVNVVSVSS